MMTSLHRGFREESGFRSKFESTATSNQDAAELLLKVRMIATHEVIEDAGGLATPVTPLQGPKKIFALQSVPPVSFGGNIPTLNSTPSKNADASSTGIRFRAISFDLNEASKDLSNSTRVSISPLEGFQLNAPIIPPKPDPAVRTTSLRSRSTTRQASNKLSQKGPSVISSFTTSLKEPSPTAPAKKCVGDTLAPGVAVSGILRKKFSWKQFAELEAYLVDHRPQYLSCSNSLNYTKAQKLYNNELTQGLLDLAAAKGYIFEGFTFAAVRDRIRCFYKSFVQASKKKKRSSKHRGRVGGT